MLLCFIIHRSFTWILRNYSLVASSFKGSFAYPFILPLISLFDHLYICICIGLNYRTKFGVLITIQ